MKRTTEMCTPNFKSQGNEKRLGISLAIQETKINCHPTYQLKKVFQEWGSG